MANVVDAFLGGVDSILAWMSMLLKTTVSSYCDLETADSPTVLVSHDGSLLSIIKVNGVTTLLGSTEFDRLYQGVAGIFLTALSRDGYEIQVLFNYNPEKAQELIGDIYEPAKATAARLKLDLDDLFEERVNYLARYCAEEEVFLVLWTRPRSLSSEQMSQAAKTKAKFIAENKMPPFNNTQFPMAAIPDLRNAHDSFVRATMNDLATLNLDVRLLQVHEALYEVRMSVDPDFTDKS